MAKLQIKNMVCPRCIMAVENVFNQLKINFVEVRLGEVILTEKLNENQLHPIKEELQKLGFEVLDDKNSAVINQIKVLILEQLQSESTQNMVLSEFISKKLSKDYSYLSKLFSATTGMTIEQYSILQKIEKVKELLVYDELNLKEIAFRLGYSSPAHLSAQFKKVSGLSPTDFKNLNNKERKSLDSV